jgi:hypothetical protein
MSLQYVHVEFDSVRVSVEGDIKDGHRKHVHFTGKRWITDVVENVIYKDPVWADFYSEKEVTNEDIQVAGGHGNIWCDEYGGTSTIQVQAILPEDWFKTILDMAIGFTDRHIFQASFTTLEEADLRPIGGTYPVTGFRVSMALKVPQTFD